MELSRFQQGSGDLGAWLEWEKYILTQHSIQTLKAVEGLLPPVIVTINIWYQAMRTQMQCLNELRPALKKSECIFKYCVLQLQLQKMFDATFHDHSPICPIIQLSYFNMIVFFHPRNWMQHSVNMLNSNVVHVQASRGLRKMIQNSKPMTLMKPKDTLAS